MIDAVTDPHASEFRPAAHAARLAAVAPAAVAALYPFIIKGFRTVVTVEDDGHPTVRLAALALLLTAAFAVPAVGFLFSFRVTRLTAVGIRARRIAFFAVTAPPLFVFSGILFGVLGIAPWRDWVWLAAWGALWLWAGTVGMADSIAKVVPPPRWTGKLRVIHGLSAVAIVLFVAFHLANHVAALEGAASHAAFMNAGRKIYRAPIVEPVLIALLLFQVASGLRLAWIWSARPADRFRMFQLVSGFYMAVFILVHMNSVLVYARGYRKIETGWDFMTGQPLGLIHGSIHLVPHYALGVFFVLGHLASGLRQLALAHGAPHTATNRLWGAGLAAAGAVAAAAIAGITL